MKRILALGLAAALFLSGCGPSTGTEEDGQRGQSGAGSNAEGQQGLMAENRGGAMGRYVESGAELPEGAEYARDIRLGDNCLELTTMDGTLYRSQDQGQSWQLVSQVPEELREPLNQDIMTFFKQNQAGDIVAGYFKFQKDEEGNYDMGAITHEHALFLADGTRISLEVPEQGYISAVDYDEAGTFYLGSSSRIYRVNGSEGSLEVLAELGSRCDFLTVCGKYLMIQGEKLQIYDLEENKMAEPDPVLEEFLGPWLGAYGDVGHFPYLLWQSRTEEKSLYVLTRQGLYHHTLYGSTMEQLIDGSLCSMSNLDMGFVNMLELGEAFWVLYGGVLKQYVYDPAAPAMPENVLRVWGLYADEDIQRVIGAFAQSHPDLYITYEHPLSEDTGMTREDAMKVLSTELATGNGPDVLLLDDLPYDTYVEKGVLADLTEALDGTGERYMEVVRESYRRGGGQYAMPMALAVPVLTGAQDKIKGVVGLEELAELMEQSRAAQPQGSLLGFDRAEDALKLLAISSMDSWMSENGGVNSQGVREFLTQAKRIYDAQLAGLTAGELRDMEQRQMYVNGQPVMRTEAGYQMTNAMYYNQPFAMGMLDSNLSVMGGYCTVAELLKVQDIAMVPLSGPSGFTGQVSRILAVNETSKVKEQALELVTYALSAQFCSESYIMAGSTNWDVLEEEVRQNQERQIGSCMGFEDINGREVLINIGSPSPEALEALRQLLETCQGVAWCDSRVYDAVIGVGQLALTGDMTVEEAVKEIEKKVSLYLAE